MKGTCSYFTMTSMVLMEERAFHFYINKLEMALISGKHATSSLLYAIGMMDWLLRYKICKLKYLCDLVRNCEYLFIFFAGKLNHSLPTTGNLQNYSNSTFFRVEFQERRCLLRMMTQ